MRLTPLLLAIASFKAVNGHTLFSTLFINDKSQGDATCIRMPMDGATSTSPLIDLSSNDMACNVDGSKGVARVCPVPRGSRLTFAWRWTANEPDKGSIDISHKGPCAVYMKKAESAIKDPGHGDGWFKIYEDGHDDKTDKWCTEKLIDAGGLLSVNLPTDLAGGYYLVRPELLSLHQAFADDNNPTSQPQFYTGCAQIFLDSDATGTPTETIKIPGYVKPDDPAATFNIYYNQNFPYPQLGPPVSNITTSNSRVRVKSRAPLGPQTEGLKPENCVDENGNWCGIELDPYDSLDGCLAAGKQCWEQLDPCYEGAPPTGYKGCSAWEAKCSEMTDKCNAKDFVGPPNKGKILTPEPHKYDLTKAMGMPPVKAVVPDVEPSQAPSSPVVSSSAAPSSSVTVSTAVVASSSVVSSAPSASSSQAAEKPSATTAASSSAVQIPPPGVDPSNTADAPAATTAPSSPGYVNDGSYDVEPDNEEDYDIVYVTETVTVNVNAAAETPCPSDKAKRQTFEFKPAPEPAAEPAVSSPDSSSPINAGNSFPIIAAPEAPAPVEPNLPPLAAPVFSYKDGSDSSISAQTRPIIPTLDGSCGLVSGFRCEYDSILGTIPGCCSKFGYCGYTPDHCDTGCQIGFGRCDGAPLILAKRYSSHLSVALRTRQLSPSEASAEDIREAGRRAGRLGAYGGKPFAATVTVTSICEATPGPRNAFIPDLAEHQRVHAAKLFGSAEGGRTVTVDATPCTSAAAGQETGHQHRHLHVNDRLFS